MALAVPRISIWLHFLLFVDFIFSEHRKTCTTLLAVSYLLIAQYPMIFIVACAVFAVVCELIKGGKLAFWTSKSQILWWPKSLRCWSWNHAFPSLSPAEGFLLHFISSFSTPFFSLLLHCPQSDKREIDPPKNTSKCGYFKQIKVYECIKYVCMEITWIPL